MNDDKKVFQDSVQLPNTDQNMRNIWIPGDLYTVSFFNPAYTQDWIHAELPNICTGKLLLYTPKFLQTVFCYSSDT